MWPLKIRLFVLSAFANCNQGFYDFLVVFLLLLSFVAFAFMLVQNSLDCG